MLPAYRRTSPAGSPNCAEFVQTKPIGRFQAFSRPGNWLRFARGLLTEALRGPGSHVLRRFVRQNWLRFARSAPPGAPSNLVVLRKSWNGHTCLQEKDVVLTQSHKATKLGSRSLPVPLCVFVSSMRRHVKRTSSWRTVTAHRESCLCYRRFPPPVCYAQTKITEGISPSMATVRAFLGLHIMGFGSGPEMLFSPLRLPAGMFRRQDRSPGGQTRPVRACEGDLSLWPEA